MNCKRKLVNLNLTTALLIVLLSAFSSASAQESHSQSVTMEITGDVLMLTEVGGIITESGDTVQVQMVMPAEHRPKEYKDVDLEAGDIIKMANGKKINSVSDLSELYDNLSIGEALKFGIYRGKRMMMTSLVKGDPENMPVQMMMVTDSDGGGEDLDISPALAGAGILVGFDGTVIKIEDMIEKIKIPFEGSTPQAGDLLLTINGEKVESLEKLDKLISNIKSGDKVGLKLLRDGEKVVSSFEMPDSSEQPMIKRSVIKKGE